MYRFDQFVLDPSRRTLSRANSPVFLTPKAFDVLLFLVQNPNRIVTKEELLQAVWGNTFVEDGNLTQYVSHVRRALGGSRADGGLIATIARKGYQFTPRVAVEELKDASEQSAVLISAAEIPPADTLPTLFARFSRRWRHAAVLAAVTALFATAAYSSWRHFRNETSPRVDKITLAVLPFENLTGDSNNEYLADGLTEEMISQLSRLDPEQLRVISRTSVMGYKHKDERLDQIGRDLSVQYVLENSLRESGSRLRLTAQLVEVKNQTHLWSQEYDYPTKDIFTVEEDVAKAVSREVQLRLTSQQRAEMVRQRPANAEAFDAYMQGFYFFERNTDEDTNRSAKSYERAVQLDPSYALAWVGLSRARHWQAVRGLIALDDGRRLAREAVVRALGLNPNLATAHVQMGRIKRQDDFDWAGADASTERALTLEPENPEIVRLAAFSALILGRFDESILLNHRAVELDPLNAESWESLAEAEFFAGLMDQSAASTNRALELQSDLWYCHYHLSQISILQGRPQDALPGIGQVQERLSDWGLHLRALAYHALGQRKESDDALTELIAKYQGIDEYLIARTYAFRNQHDEAFEWLDRAYAKHDDGLIETKIDPFLKSLHSDPRYAALLKKLNLPN
jgi:TolB-like protein/DNA-binding winged helix-turn-helix (wHTH) protein/tetratricopeptide (TPR) repeat protein